MKPYRDLFPHAGLMLGNTHAVAERLIVLPNGMGVPQEAVHAVCDVIRLSAATGDGR
jgi:dTDP-4-amino-4,6-dideoxygalactose transaminase